MKKFAFLLFLYAPLICASETLSRLEKINAVTIRPSSETKKHTNSNTINDLVKYINVFDTVPKHTYLQINDKVHKIYKGVRVSPEDTFVYIFSRGYALFNTPTKNEIFVQRGACAAGAYRQLRDNIIINGPVISFDFDDDTDGFTFGQTRAINMLKAIYNEILNQNPNAQIVLVGDCRGAKVALEWATRRPRNLNSLVLLSPFVSAREISDHMGKNYLPSILRPLLYPFFKALLKKYDEKKDDLYDRLSAIDPNIPVFIAHRMNDAVISLETVESLRQHLKDAGNEKVDMIKVYDTTCKHSRLNGNKDVQKAVNKFYKKHKLPYLSDFGSE